MHMHEQDTDIIVIDARDIESDDEPDYFNSR